MGHNSGARPERIRIATLSARNEVARNAQAVAITNQWNAELAAAKRPQFSPTLEAAFRARRPWLRLFCAGCQQQYEIDLRRIVRPQDSRSWHCVARWCARACAAAKAPRRSCWAWNACRSTTAERRRPMSGDYAHDFR